MKNDLYQDIEDALLSQEFLKNEGEFSPDTEVFHFSDSKNNTGKSQELLSGNTTMYMDAIKALDASNNLSDDIGKLDNMKDMSTTDFLGETDFLGYTAYLEGKHQEKVPHGEGSYEEYADENDNPFRNVFGLGPKKKPDKKPAKTSGKNSGKNSASHAHSAKSPSNSSKGSHKSSRGTPVAKSAAKAALKGTDQAVSTGKKAVMGGVHLIQLIIRLFSFILMLSTAFQIASICYAHINDLGEVAYMIPYKNYAQFIYIFVAALTVIFAVISALRILAARRRIVRGKAVNEDYGQGFLPFLLFIILAVCSGVLPNYIPYIPELQGLILFLNMIQIKSAFLIKVNTIGALLCLTRKLTHSL